MDEEDFVPADLQLDKVLNRGDHVEIADEMVRRLKKGGDVVYSDGQLWRFNCVIYRPVLGDEKSRTVQGMAGIPIKTAKGSKPLSIDAKDVRGAIALAQDRVTNVEFFSKAPSGLVFSNAFVRVDKDGINIEKPEPRHRARFAYDFAYEPEQVPELWFDFLVEAFDGDVDAEQKIALLQEYVGVSLLGLAPMFQKALVLKGEGSNGKGVLARVVDSCFPADSTSAIPPQEWENEYRRAMLAGKRLNLVAELPEKDIMTSEAFKAIVAGDIISGRHIRQDPFKFRASAGHIFSVNPPLPQVQDYGYAFWRRWLMIEFNHRVDENNKVLDLAEQLIEERSAIVPWFLEGAQRALVAGRYTVPESSDRAIEDWKGNADQVFVFVRECCEKLEVSEDELGTQADGKIIGTKAGTLYYQYEQWTKATGHKPMNNVKFGARMQNLRLGSVRKSDGSYYAVTCKDVGRRFS